MILNKPLAFIKSDNDVVKNNHFVKKIKNMAELRANMIYDDDRNEIPEWMKLAASKL